MSNYTQFGPGTIEVSVGGQTAQEFAGEVLSVTIKHDYEDVGETRTFLDGTKRAASQVRNDGLAASIENDLTAAGLYAWLVDHDGQTASVTYTPSTADGATWKVDGLTLRLPAEVKADEYGSPLASDIEWVGGTMTFTPAGAA